MWACLWTRVWSRYEATVPSPHPSTAPSVAWRTLLKHLTSINDQSKRSASTQEGTQVSIAKIKTAPKTKGQSIKGLVFHQSLSVEKSCVMKLSDWISCDLTTLVCIPSPISEPTSQDSSSNIVNLVILTSSDICSADAPPLSLHNFQRHF